MNHLDSDHLTGSFGKAIDRANNLLGYGAKFEEVCIILSTDHDREFAYWACVAASLELMLIK